jgi:hypothetical protein
MMRLEAIRNAMQSFARPTSKWWTMLAEHVLLGQRTTLGMMRLAVIRNAT